MSQVDWCFSGAQDRLQALLKNSALTLSAAPCAMETVGPIGVYCVIPDVWITGSLRRKPGLSRLRT
jgi:hypothetical protein